MTFWYGFGSADPYHLFTDPGLDPDPDPALYFSDFQDVIKKNKFVSPFFAYYCTAYCGCSYISLKENKSQNLRKQGFTVKVPACLMEGFGFVQIITDPGTPVWISENGPFL